jgi:uncharacterized protein (DUF983 family)
MGMSRPYDGRPAADRTHSGKDASMRSLGRALLARCPVCGEGEIWERFGETVEHCPGCGYSFSREEGYWAGALIVAMAIVLLLFFVIFVGGIVLFWPDVPWNALLLVSLVAIGGAPFLLYPQSKTIWVWLDQRVHPYDPSERDWENP